MGLLFFRGSELYYVWLNTTYKGLAERGGVLSKQHVSVDKSIDSGVFLAAKNALKAITDIKAQILAHVPDRQDEEE